jgi:DNA-binding CsgD family transcriptional regulator
MSGSPTVKILLLTSTITSQQIIEAVQIGARGIVPKEALADHLTTAIRAVSSRDYWIGGRRVVDLVGALHELMQQALVPERKTHGLTPRELEVVGCMVEGRSNPDIAGQFSISEEKVKRHVPNASTKPESRRAWSWRCLPSRIRWLLCKLEPYSLLVFPLRAVVRDSARAGPRTSMAPAMPRSPRAQSTLHSHSYLNL